MRITKSAKFGIITLGELTHNVYNSKYRNENLVVLYMPYGYKKTWIVLKTIQDSHFYPESWFDTTK